MYVLDTVIRIKLVHLSVAVIKVRRYNYYTGCIMSFNNIGAVGRGRPSVSHSYLTRALGRAYVSKSSPYANKKRFEAYHVGITQLALPADLISRSR